MHRLLSLLAIATLFSACSDPSSAGGQGLVMLEPENPDRPFFHDAGALPYGSSVEHTWSFRNTDSEPVTIKTANPACACTRLKDLRYLPEDGSSPVRGDLDAGRDLLTVPAGATLELVVGISTTSLQPNTDRLAVMRVTTSSRVTPFLTFEVHVKADKPFLVKPAEIRIGDIPLSHGGAGKTLVMTGVRGGAARILDVLEVSGGLEAELDYQFVNGEHHWTVLARVPGGRDMGVIHERVTLSTTDSDGLGDDGRLILDVWANVVEDVYVAPRMHFGVIREGEPKTMDVGIRALVPGMRVRVEGVQLVGESSEFIEVLDILPVGYVDDEGRTNAWTLKLQAGDSLPQGAFDLELLVGLDDEQYPEVKSRIQGVVR